MYNHQAELYLKKSIIYIHVLPCRAMQECSTIYELLFDKDKNSTKKTNDFVNLFKSLNRD